MPCWMAALLGPQERIFVSILALGLSPLETRIFSENRVLKIAKTSNNIHQTLILYNSNYTHNHNTNHVVFCHSNVCCCKMRSEIHSNPPDVYLCLAFSSNIGISGHPTPPPNPPPFKMSVSRFVKGFHCILFWRFSWGFVFLLCGGLEV